MSMWLMLASGSRFLIVSRIARSSFSSATYSLPEEYQRLWCSLINPSRNPIG